MAKRTLMLMALVAALVVSVPSVVGAVSADETKLTASDGSSRDQFGIAVAVAGDVIVVGAYADDDDGAESGAAYVFTPDGVGGYTEAKLTASDAGAGDWFGWSVAADGATVVVGARYDDDGGADSGAAYVFTPDGVGGYTEAKLTASDAAPGDEFGGAVAAADGVIVVGAHGSDTGGSDAGAAYLFTPDGVGGYAEAKLTASDAAATDQFGWSVATDDGEVAVGAYGNDDAGTDSGSAYHFSPDGVGGYTETKITASDAAADDWFGYSVAIASGSVAVGSMLDDDGASGAGSAYVFGPDGLGGFTESKLTASDAGSGDWFGRSIAADSAAIVVGATSDDDNGSSAGAVYHFAPDGVGGFTESKLTASDGAAGDEYGRAVAIAGDLVAVGAFGDDDNGTASGSAYALALTTPLCDGQPVTVDIGAGDMPTTGDDVILGTSGDDIINALDGNDVVCAGAGVDSVVGGPGDDRIFGGAGGDTLSGNAGNDLLIGDGGADRIFGGSGDDTIEGRFGNDTLGGGGDRDVVSGDEGGDTISGGSGDDGAISGGPGADAVNGGGDDDANVSGDDGDDTVSGNGGKDTVDGGAGDDTVRGGQNDDTVNGGPGDDVVAGNEGSDICDGGTLAETNGDSAAVNCETVLNVP